MESKSAMPMTLTQRMQWDYTPEYTREFNYEDALARTLVAGGFSYVRVYIRI